VDVVYAGPKPELGVVCSWFSTNQNLGPRNNVFTLLTHLYKVLLTTQPPISTTSSLFSLLASLALDL